MHFACGNVIRVVSEKKCNEDHVVRLWLLILLVLLWPFACFIFFFWKRIFHLEFGLSVSLVHFFAKSRRTLLS